MNLAIIFLLLIPSGIITALQPIVQMNNTYGISISLNVNKSVEYILMFNNEEVRIEDTIMFILVKCY